MLLWIVMAVLTAAASLAVLVPLGRPLRSDAGADPSARSIYRDQLDELTRDNERGLIADGEADAARTEIMRRLLKAEPTAPTDGKLRDGRLGAVLVAAVAIPLIAVATYLALGSPGLVDQPAATRTIPKGSDEELDALVAKVEQHLGSNPEDGKGWEVLGPVYLQQGRFDDAVRAFENARRILGPTADRDALVGEAITKAHGGVVTVDAKAAFDRALVEQPDHPRALFYTALGLGQAGRKDEAVAAWSKLIAASPPDAPWLGAAREQLARLDGTATATAPAAAGPVAPGPTAEDMAAAAEKTPQDRQAMIEGMVAGLAARLDTAPEDVGGWARLFRAYIVLGRMADAEAALGRARTALASKPDLLAQVESAAAENGIGKDKANP